MMPNLKFYLSLAYFIVLVVLLSIIFFGCSSTPTIVEKPFVITIPEFRDSTIVLRDTVIVQDSLWYGEVTDSLNEVIGELKVHFNKKIAELKLYEKRDTVYIKDTLVYTNNTDRLLPVVNSVFSWWEKGILYGGLGMILSFLIYLRVKRGKLI